MPDSVPAVHEMRRPGKYQGQRSDVRYIDAIAHAAGLRITGDGVDPPPNSTVRFAVLADADDAVEQGLPLSPIRVMVKCRGQLWVPPVPAECREESGRDLVDDSGADRPPAMPPRPDAT